jgi:tol-pal system protein YbgF
MQGHPAASHGRAHGRPWFLKHGSAIAFALLAGGCVTPGEHRPRGEERARVEPPPPAPAAPRDADADARRDADATQTREHLRRLDASVAEMQRKLQELEKGVRARTEPTAEASARQGELTDELRRLRAALDQQGQRLDALDKALAQAQRGRAERPVAQGRAPAERPPRPESSPAPTPRATAPADDKTGFLALARDQERQGERTVAREMYEQYATEFPGDPSTAEVHFRLGELAFGDRRYRDAIVEFGRVASEFPRSEQAPGSLLRTAESMLQLGMKDDAAAVLSEIPKQYPGSPAAAQARKQLAKVSAAAGKKSD